MSAEKPQKKEKRPPEGHPRQEQIGPRHRAWSARSLARDVRIAAPFCNLDSIRKASARSALSSCTPVSNALILIRPRGLNACSRFRNASPARTSATIADSTNFAPRLKRILLRRLPLRDQRLPPSTFRAPAMPVKHSRISLRSKSNFDPSIRIYFPQLCRYLCLQPHERIVILKLPMRLRIPPRVAPSFRCFPGKAHS